MSPSRTTDAELYQAAHELLFQQGSGERRRGPRHPYKCSQLLAPYDGKTLPRQSDFSWVQCTNISARGLSFFWPEPPRFQSVVVALGGVPFIFVSARLVHANAHGEYFLCGCEFQKRLDRTSGKGVDATAAPLDASLVDLLARNAGQR